MSIANTIRKLSLLLGIVLFTFLYSSAEPSRHFKSSISTSIPVVSSDKVFEDYSPCGNGATLPTSPIDCEEQTEDEQTEDDQDDMKVKSFNKNFHPQNDKLFQSNPIGLKYLERATSVALVIKNLQESLLHKRSISLFILYSCFKSFLS